MPYAIILGPDFDAFPAGQRVDFQERWWSGGVEIVASPDAADELLRRIVKHHSYRRAKKCARFDARMVPAGATAVLVVHSAWGRPPKLYAALDGAGPAPLSRADIEAGVPVFPVLRVKI